MGGVKVRFYVCLSQQGVSGVGPDVGKEVGVHIAVCERLFVRLDQRLLL
jgi:hypothetical protein